jgi:hypothetical protein
VVVILDYTRVLKSCTTLRILVSGQSCGTARTLNKEPYRLNSSNLSERAKNGLSLSGRLCTGENIYLEYMIPYSTVWLNTGGDALTTLNLNHREMPSPTTYFSAEVRKSGIYDFYLARARKLRVSMWWAFHTKKCHNDIRMKGHRREHRPRQTYLHNTTLPPPLRLGLCDK